MKTKIFSGVLILFFILTAFLQTAYAESIITNRTGSIKIIMPNKTVITVKKDDNLPEIPSGAIVEILDGSMEIAPKTGAVQVIAGNLASVIKAGDRVALSINRETGIVDFTVEAGGINVIAGNTTIMIKMHQSVQVRLDNTRGIVEVKSVIGVIETITAGVRVSIPGAPLLCCLEQGGVKVSIPDGAAAKIRVDAGTKIVHIESEAGSIEVLSIDGKTTTVAKGESISIQGSALSKIQTFPGEAVRGLFREEPAEPERPEGSRFSP